jgi:hypothetical protein
MGYFDERTKPIGKKIGGFFQDPAGTIKTELGNLGEQLKAGPLAGGTPKTDIGAIVKPQDTTNPYAAAAGQSVSNIQTLGGELAKLYGTGAGAMTGLIGQLQGQTRGDFGPGGSLAQQVLQQGLSKNIGDIRTQLASQRGLSPALAASIAATKQAELGGQTTQQAGILGLQQQLAAQGQLAGLSQQAATLGSEGQLRALNQLATSDVGMRQLIAQTGLGKEEIAAKIAAANQAAAAGDKEALVKFFTSLGTGAAQTSAAQGLIPGLAPAAGAGGAGAGAGAAGGAAAAAPAAVAALAHGGRIDGMAPYAGDTPKNDVVSAKLSPGEIVIPRSAAGSKKAAKSFIESLDDWDDEPSYSKVLKARQKKNYSDGGQVGFPMSGPYAPVTQEKLDAATDKPLPAAQRLKTNIDDFLTGNVVEPLAQRGYPNLGAALATVPSVAAEMMIPSTTGELQGAVIPGSGFKKALKSSISAMPGTKLAPEASRAIKQNKAIDLLEQLAADEVDISKLPNKSEFKTFEKQYQEAKQLQSRAERGEKEAELFADNRTRIKSIFKELLPAEAKKPNLATDIFERAKHENRADTLLFKLAEDNSDIKDISKALNDYKIADSIAGGMTVKGQMGKLAQQQKLSKLLDALERNQSKLDLTGSNTLPENISRFPGKK